MRCEVRCEENMNFTCHPDTGTYNFDLIIMLSIVGISCMISSYCQSSIL